jgi:hypothetical protein
MFSSNTFIHPRIWFVVKYFMVAQLVNKELLAAYIDDFLATLGHSTIRNKVTTMKRSDK